MTLEFMKVILPAVMATAVAAFLGKTLLLFSDITEIRKRRIARVRDLISKKLNSDISITAKDVADIGRGVGASPGISVEALYGLFADAEGKEQHAQLRALIDELNREEPFETLPEVSRPSLARLAALCEGSPQTSDRELLHPIRKLLEEYQEMKKDHARIKRQSKTSYIVAIISFFIGVVGLILAFRGPSKAYISSEMSSMTENIVKTIQAQQSVAGYPPQGVGSPEP